MQHASSRLASSIWFRTAIVVIASFLALAGFAQAAVTLDSGISTDGNVSLGLDGDDTIDMIGDDINIDVWTGGDLVIDHAGSSSEFNFAQADITLNADSDLYLQTGEGSVVVQDTGSGTSVTVDTNLVLTSGNIILETGEASATNYDSNDIDMIADDDFFLTANDDVFVDADEIDIVSAFDVYIAGDNGQAIIGGSLAILAAGDPLPASNYDTDDVELLASDDIFLTASSAIEFDAGEGASPDVSISAGVLTIGSTTQLNSLGLFNLDNAFDVDATTESTIDIDGGDLRVTMPSTANGDTFIVAVGNGYPAIQDNGDEIELLAESDIHIDSGEGAVRIMDDSLTVNSSGVSIGANGNTITNVVVDILTDGSNGWDPNDATDTFTVTADADAITANSHITVSTQGDTNAAICMVTARVAATSFTVSCDGSVANGATLFFTIFN